MDETDEYYTVNPLLVGLTTSQVNRLYDLMMAVNIASVALSGLTLLGYYLHKETRRKANETFSFYFGIASGGFNLSLLMVDMTSKDKFLDDEPWCLVQGFMVEFFLNSTLMWWFFMTFHMWFSIVRGNLQLRKESTKFYHAVGWGSSFIISSILLLCNQIGNSGFWCWIKGENFNLQLYVFYLQMSTYLVVGVCMWISTISKVRKIIARQYRNRDTNTTGNFYLRVLRQIIFIVCFCVVFCISFSNRVRLHENKNRDNVYSLWRLQIATTGIVGIFYCVIFLSTDLYTHWIEKLKRLAGNTENDEEDQWSEIFESQPIVAQSSI